MNTNIARKATVLLTAMAFAAAGMPNATAASGSGTGARPAAVTPAATSNVLAATQQAQQTSYWCGPATLSESLKQRGVTYSQSSSATLLKTTTAGTAWYGININVPSPTGYPMRDAMNYKLGTSWYLPVALPYSPTSANKATYKSYLVFDIDQGYPILGNAWEVVGGPHLVGHPNREIFHWFNIRGYASSGATTYYEDSVHGATSISWSGSVPAYSSIDSNTVTTIMGGRGYVW